MFAASTSSAQAGPEVARGLAWLQDQVQPDGSLSGEATSLSHPLQARSETLHTLGQLGAPASSLLPLQTALAADSENNTEFMARRAMVLGLRGLAQPDLIEQLQQSRNVADGGYGGSNGYASHALDTAFVLRAQRASSAFDPAAVSAALAFLASAENTDGAFAANGRSSLYTTAHALLAATAWSDQPGAGAIGVTGQQWLLAQRNAERHFGNASDNALVLWALLGHTSRSEVLQPLVDALRASQLADGSWDHDPYVTAIALRALFLASQPAPPPAAGSLQGMVTSATAVGLANATVQIVGTSIPPTVADGAGRYSFSSVPAGALTVRVSLSGYASRDIAVTLTAGQSLNLGNTVLSPSSLTATVGGVIRSHVGHLVPDAFVAIGTAYGLTDASGAYQLTGLSPGPATVSIKAAGFQSISAPFTLEANVAYVFSPRLTATTGTPPTLTSISGVLIDEASKNALVGASVQLSGSATVLTVVGGAFNFPTVTPGAFSLTLSATGYKAMQVAGVSVAGVNSLGNISLAKLPATTTLSGTITDAATKLAIAGVMVKVDGQGMPVLTGGDGKYLIAGLNGTSFTLMVSASGYLARSEQIKISEVGPGVADLALQAQGSSDSDVSFIKVETFSPSYPASGVIPLEMVLANNAAQSTAVQVSALVLNEQDSVVYEYLASPIIGWQGLNYGNDPVTLAPNSSFAIIIDWNSSRLPAGPYRVKASALDVNGRMVAQAETTFSVTAGAMLGGGVSADPPLAQAGAQTKISLTGDLTNTGNMTLPAGDLSLRILLDRADNSANKVGVVGRSIAAGAPMMSATKLAADAQGNFYTINALDNKLIKIGANGTQTVLATLPAAAWSIDLAIDPDGAIVVAGNNPAKLFKVTQLGAVSTLAVTGLKKILGLDIANDGSYYLSGEYSNGEWGLVRRSPAGVETELARNGFSSPYGMVKDGQGNFIVTNHGNGSLVKVSADGKMAPFVTGLNAPKGITIDAAGNFFVANSGAKTIVKVTPDGRSSVFATGLKDPTDLRFDPTGNLYVSNAGDDSIDRVLPSGVVELFAKGLAYKPKNMRYDAAGNLWLSNEDNTLRKKDAQDKVSVVAAGLSLPRGIAFPGNGDVLVAEAGSGKISRVRGGVVSPFAIGLSYPTGLAIDDAGTLFAAERDANRIARFDSAGNKLGVIESALLEPSAMRANASGEVFIKNTGFVTMLKDGKLRVLHRNFNYSHWTPDTVSGGFIALSGNSVIRLAPDGAVTTVKSGLPFTPAGVTLGESGTIVLLDSANRKLHKLDGGGALTVLSILPFGISAGEMQADNNGKIFLRLLDARFYRVLSDGSLAALTFGASEPVVGWTAGRNGELVVWSASKTYRLDSISNTTSVWFPAIGSAPGASAIHGAAVDSAGNLAAANSGGHVLNVYGGSGTRVAQFHGFTLPRDIVWTGSEMRFVDGADGLFSMTGDSYPVKKPGTLLAQFLAHSGAETLGVSGTGIIYRWTGNGSLGYDTYFTAADSLSGIAAKGDGTLAIGTTTSRVIILDQTRAIVRDFAGLRTPQGLAFDASGRLYVANFDGETVGRFDSLAVPLATTFAKVTNPRALAIDAAGRVTLSAGFTIYRLDASGNASTLSAEGHTFNSLLADGADMYAADFANAQLRKLNISAGIASWDVFATGVAEPVAVRVAADSGVFVLNKGSNTIVKFDAGKIGTVARVPAGMNALALAANGALTAVGNSGVAVRVASDGAVSGLGIELLVNKWDLSGVHDAGNGKLYVLSNNRNAPNFGGLLEVSVTEAPVTPPAGTMVFQASVPMAAMEANGSYARFDFGKWTPPYGGDFKIELWREGIEGKASNFVHVGPHAEALLSAARTMVAPGDSELNMCLDLKGADFTSISRVETGQVRAVSAALSPIGMVGDRQGRLYVTDRTSLYRTNESGESVKIADGMKLARGLAIDAEQNFYVVSEKPGSGNYELIRISPAGVKTVVADLGVKPDSGVETAGGVQVNSKDEVLVGTRGKLLKVDKQGVVTVVTTSGLPSPISIAIDGRDNVYVQNALHIVTKIAADGTSSTIFSKADRVNDPLFENEGMSIAADCADNLYVAAQIWGKFNQSGEEHTLAQVAPRTGNVALVFDTLKIDPTLGDIDDIAFDRFNNRILMWNHGTNRIWQVPVTCGAIGVQAHLVAQPGQTLTGASKPPSATIPRADGRTEYVWSLRDVPAQGAQVCFSATQRNFMLGEERKAIDSGFISFQNSFAAGDITVPLAVPLVRAVNLVNLNVGTDLPVYAPNTNAVVSTTLVNTDTQAVSGTLKVQVFDSAGKLVADIGEQQVSLAGAGAIPVIAPFNTGAIVAGNYSVVAVLVGDNGTVARSQSDFKVVDAGAAAPAHATVASDRTLYQPNERVVLTTRVFNDSSSAMLDSLGLALQVFDAAGAIQFEHAETVLQLPPGTHRDYSVTQPPRALAPGVYTVRQTLRDGAGVLFGQSTTSYTVASTADTGTGLSGSVLVMPKTVKIGESLALMLAVTNQGNSVLKDLPFKLDIADPVEQRIVAEFPFARSLDIGATFNTAVNWIAAGVEGRNYVAVLTALAGGKTVTLGQDDFKLLAATASPIKLDINQNLVNGNRVLVLVSCKDGEAETDAQGKPAACITERAQTIAAALTQAGASFTIATGESAFKRELRGGGYNGYWISGKQDKLHDALAGELREAAFNGDGLILDSEHDQRNKVIDAATGVRWSGKIGETGLPVNVAGAAFPQQSLNTVGRALKMAATTGKAEAVFAGGKPNSSGPAIVSNTYGKGRAMTYGFDLPASLRAEPAWQTNLQASLAQVLPAASFGPGAVVPVHTRVGNLAQATGVSVRSVLPAGAVYLNSVPLGSYEAGASTVNWSFPLAEAEAKDLQLTFRLAADGEAGTLSTVVSSVRDGVATPYGEPLNLVLGGTGGEHEPAGPRALALLNALVLNKNGERQLRTRLAGRIEGALLQMNANTPAACETAIGELIGVIDGLPGLGDVNTIPVRQALDRLLKEAQWRWSQLPQDPP